jgi:drug/metabolite transporter (DMT)-like permease
VTIQLAAGIAAAVLSPAAPVALTISEEAGLAATGVLGAAVLLHGLAWYGGRQDAGPKAWFDLLGVVFGGGGLAASRWYKGYTETGELAYWETANLP